MPIEEHMRRNKPNHCQWILLKTSEEIDSYPLIQQKTSEDTMEVTSNGTNSEDTRRKVVAAGRKIREYEDIQRQ